MKSIRWSAIILIVCLLCSFLTESVAEDTNITNETEIIQEICIPEDSEEEDTRAEDSDIENGIIISDKCEPEITEEELSIEDIAHENTDDTIDCDSIIDAEDEFIQPETQESLDNGTDIDIHQDIIDDPKSFEGNSYLTVGDYVIDPYDSMGEKAYCTIVSYRGKSSNITIPSYLDGYVVSFIGNAAFAGNNYLSSVVFPSTLVSIYKSAFKGCTKLQQITFKGDNIDIWEECFEQCTSLTNISIPQNARGFICGKNAFLNCVSLKSITLPGEGPWEECFVNCTNLSVSFDIDSVYMANFVDNYNIKEIRIPEYCEIIDDYCLRGCTGAIVSIYSKNIEYIGEGAFEECKEIRVIKGSKTHKYCKAHRIKVKTFNPYAPSSIALKASGSTLLTPKKGVQLTATLSPATARSKLTWKSSKKSVATVSKSGYVKAKKKGTTTITVKTANGKKASIKITVKANPKKVTLSAKSLALNVGKTAQLSATLPKNTYATLSYSSSNTAVARVDQSGKVTAVKGGQATITVTTSNGKRASCLVTVLTGPAPTSLTLNAATCTLKPKGKFTIVPKINSGASTAYTFTTSNKKVATVAANGIITAKKKGKAVITVRTHNGLTTQVTVIVKK